MKLQSAAIARSTNLTLNPKFRLDFRCNPGNRAYPKLGQNFFKIRQSVGLFTFLLMGGSNVNTANRNLSWTGANQLGILWEKRVSAGLNLDFFNQEQIKQMVMAGLELRTLRLQD